MDIKELFNQGIITYDVCEDLLNRTCFYKDNEYELRIEQGLLILDIFSQAGNVAYDIDYHHWGI